MRSFNQFGALVAAVFALSAVGAASASAAQFTASATGSLSGKALTTQVFTTSGGDVTCTTAATSGTIAKTADTQQHVTINYSGCTAFGFATVDISPTTFQFTASGELHIVSAFKITPTLFGASICTVLVGPQTVSTMDFVNSGANNVVANFTVTGITYASSGGACGVSGFNGTLTGSIEMSRVGGGTLRFDH